MFLVLSSFLKSYSQQNSPLINLSPEGKLENIYDRFGNQYSLTSIMIDSPIQIINQRATSLTCSSTSYFNLFFENGSGMEDTSSNIHNARRAVVCKVFEDLSNFINSPLTVSGKKVNIVIKNFANENAPSGTLGLASSFYITPSNAGNTAGGVLDGEVWKTIHLGIDSYTGIYPETNFFYHGKVAFNFDDPNIQWNTDLSINSPSNLYDLYSVMLHEVSHLLGFNSFIDQNGASLTGLNYYSRYDTFLKTNNGASPLLTIGSCNMYDLSFNSSITANVLRPGCILPNNLNSSVSNSTLCNNAIKYTGSTTVPVYTPVCFELGSSLSHFEDMLFPSCSAPNINDDYFVMSNSNIVGKTKRYFKPDERNVLCDIGYNVNTSYGVNTTASGFYFYGGANCDGISVAGANDGLNNDGSYAFIGYIATTGSTSSTVTISGLLNNDVNATGFECLQDIEAPSTSTIVNTFGNSTTVITFTTTTPGLHILRYVPINGNKRGNITYLFVYIISPPNLGGCSPIPNTCDLIMNGDFEQYLTTIGLPTNVGQIIKACGWDFPFTNTQFAPNYYNSNVIPSSSPNSYLVDIPCNQLGYQDCNNNVGNGYAEIFRTNHGGNKHLLTKLKSPLQPNTQYQLTFDVSLQESKSNFSSTIQAYLSPTANVTFDMFFEMNPIPNPAMLLTSSIVSRNVNGWDRISINFTTTTGGENFLYLGFLNDCVLVSNTPTIVPSCNYFNTTSTNLSSYENLLGYYIDNVSLRPTNGALFNIPTIINCSTQLSSDLTTYLSGVPTTGTFTGNGIVFSSSNNSYSFNPQLAGNGLTTLTYSYTNSSGCLMSLNATVNVSIDYPITGSTSVCIGNTEIFTANSSSGTWSTSNTSIADIDPLTGELNPYEAGVVDINYTVTSGSCPSVSTLQVEVFDPHIIPSFSFPTTICLGSTSPILPHLSDNGIPGDWVPPIIDNHVTADYTFKPTNNCNDIFVQTITVINGGHLTANPDTLSIPYSSTAQISPNFLLNDTFDGNLLTSNYLGLLINLTSTSNGITVNQDGTLNIPAGLQPGLYTIKYFMKNTCMISNQTAISITIYNATINASKKVSFNVCYEPSAYTTHDSLLQNVTVGNFHADANNILFTNVTAPNGFSINADGTINIPLNSLPGTYTFTYDLCPISGTTGCIIGITFQLGIDTTVRANPDVFYFDTSGAFLGSNNLNNSNNILSNDGYSQDCGYSSPNSFGSVVLNGNIINLSPLPDANTLNYFDINPSGFVVNSNFPVTAGSYPFTYTICDFMHPNICSLSYGWIYVTSSSKMNNNSQLLNFDSNGVTISPNPSSGVFLISFENYIKESNIKVYSLLGQKIFETNVFEVNQHSVDLSNISNGTYLIKISIGKKNIHKLIIKN